MKIAVAGTGYVGLSMAILLAQHNEVTAVDIIPEKAELINRRQSPIVDKEIEEYLTGKVRQSVFSGGHKRQSSVQRSPASTTFQANDKNSGTNKYASRLTGEVAPPARCGEALLGCLDLVPEIQPRLVGFFRDRLLEI